MSEESRNTKAKTDNKTKNINENKNKKNVKHSKKNMKQTKAERICMIAGYFICAVLLVASIVTMVNLVKLKMLPGKFLILIGVVLAIFTLVITLLQKNLVAGMITKFLAVLILAVLVMGNSYLLHTFKIFNDMAGINTKIDNVYVYVMAASPDNELSDLSGKSIGIIKELDRENSDIVVNDIKKEAGDSVSVNEYPTAIELAWALYNGETAAIVMNSAYVGIVTGVEDYVNFETDTRVISKKEIETQVDEADTPDDYLDSKNNVFSVYVSGIDTRGSSPKVNSNSDVNILLTVNMDTRQILLISTPRDYYVPLSISGGVRDKLTHAGGYGIDVSVETLEMLYGVNIDYYVKFNFTGFIDIIDELGGVDVYSDYDFYAQDLTGTYHYNVGVNSLNGQEALVFARERHAFPDGDRQRGKNQMAVVEGIIGKLASSDTLKNYQDILSSISDSMVTSMSYDKITELVKFQLDDMRGWDIQKYSVTGFDTMNTTFSTGSQLLYVMEPDEETVNLAKQYLEQMYAGQRISVVAE